MTSLDLLCLIGLACSGCTDTDTIAQLHARGDRLSVQEAPPRSRRTFHVLLTGLGFQYGSETVAEIALPLLVIAHFGADSLLVGGYLAVQQSAWIVLGLVAGVWIDRWDKGRTLAVATLLRAAAVASIPIAALMDSLTFGHLLVVGVFVGVSTVFTSAAASSVVPEIIERPGLIRANSKLEILSTSVGMVGQTGTGFLVRWLTAPIAIIVDVVLGVAAGIVYLRLPRRKKPQEPASETSPNFTKELLDGLRTTFSSRPLFTITLTGALSNFAVAAQSAVLFVFLVDTLEQDEALVGLTLAAASVGALIGAAGTARVSASIGSRRAWTWALVLTPFAAVMVPAAAGPAAIVIVGIGYAAQALLLVVANVNALSARQAICPPHLIGRVSSVFMFVTWGLIPLGLLAGGLLGNAIGNRAALWSVCTLFAVPAVIALLAPLKKIKNFSDLAEEAGPSVHKSHK